MNFSSPTKTLAVCHAFVILFFTVSSCKADNRLISKLIPPSTKLIRQAEKEFRKDASGNKIATKTPKLNLSTNGFLALYGGYYDFSDKDGLFQFPLRHEADKLLIVVTPSVDVALLKGTTVSHMKIKQTDGPKAKSAFYQATKTKTGDKSWTWSVEKVNEPTDGIISKLSLILLTDPGNISVSTGQSPAESSEHMAIPPIQITGRIGLDHDHLNNMDILRYFEPIQNKTSTKDEKVSISLVNNP